MGEPSFKVLETLRNTLLNLQKSPDLTIEEAERIQKFGLHLITEFSLIKATAGSEAVTESASGSISNSYPPESMNPCKDGDVDEGRPNSAAPADSTGANHQTSEAA